MVAIAKSEVTNHCWVAGLAPDTEYTYKVFVKGEAWAQGERWDWSARDRALVQTGAALRQPVPHAPASENDCAVAVVRGDWRLRRRRQGRQPEPAPAAGGRRAAARGRQRRRAARADDRRQHLRRQEAARHPDRRHRRRRRRLVLHLLPAVPLHPQPRAGLSVNRQPRRGRVRGLRRSRAGRRQLLHLRAPRRRGGGWPRLARAGALLPVPLRRRDRVRLHRHVEGELLQGAPAVRVPEALDVCRRVVSRDAARRDVAHPVRAPSAVQRRAAAPQHARRWRSSCRCSIAPAWP